MDYMVLPDGSVEAYESCESSAELEKLLRGKNSPGTYWNTNANNWYLIELTNSPEGDPVRCTQCTYESVPDVVKLAAMLT